MDSNDNLICLHMKPLFPIFPIRLFSWAQCEENDAMLHRILSFQLRPLSLLLSTAAASTANLHSIIFQTELELKSQSAADLKLWTRRGVKLWIFPQPNVNLHILTTPRAKTCLQPLQPKCDCTLIGQTSGMNLRWGKKKNLCWTQIIAEITFQYFLIRFNQLIAGNR